MNHRSPLRTKNVCAALLLGLVTGLSPTSVAAEPASAPRDARAVTLNEEGAAFYSSRDYRRAVEKFIQAYAVDNDPNLLFNIASCYEGLGDAEAAVEKYREFLAAADADPAGRPHAERVIRTYEQNARTPSATRKSIEASSQEGEPMPAPQREQSSAPSVPPTSASPVSSWVPWVTLGGAVVFAGAGGVFYALGARDHSRVTDDAGYGDPNGVSSMTRAEADDLVESGRMKKRIGDSGLAVGGALATSYLVWWLFDADSNGDREGDAATVSVVPRQHGADLIFSSDF